MGLDGREAGEAIVRGEGFEVEGVGADGDGAAGVGDEAVEMMPKGMLWREKWEPLGMGNQERREVIVGSAVKLETEQRTQLHRMEWYGSVYEQIESGWTISHS